MDSNSGSRQIPPFHPIHHHHHHHGGGGHHYHHHHHHFFYISPHCPLHRSILEPKNHSPSCSFSNTYPFTQNPQTVASIPPDPQSSFHPNEIFDDAEMIQDENDKLEDEDDGDPVFVLTDEWRDFFAKSEAKRRLAKKQAKKGKK